MASTLTGTQIKNTYQSLLKLGNNGSLPTSTPSIISDGLGNNTPLQVSEIRFNTQYLASNIGLDLNFSNNTFTIGDYDFTATSTQLKVDANGQFIITNSNGGYRGFYLDFFNDSYQFGDINGVTNGSLLVIDNASSIIKTKKSINDLGLSLDFDAEKYTLGDYASVGNSMSVYVDDVNDTIFLGYDAPTGTGILYNKMVAGPSEEFKLLLGSDAPSANKIYQEYAAGTNSITLLSNAVSITLDGVSNTTNITTDELYLAGAGLVNPSAPPSPTPATYLVVYVNGIQYKMPLFNP